MKKLALVLAIVAFGITITAGAFYLGRSQAPETQAQPSVQSPSIGDRDMRLQLVNADKLSGYGAIYQTDDSGTMNFFYYVWLPLLISVWIIPAFITLCGGPKGIAQHLRETMDILKAPSPQT